MHRRIDVFFVVPVHNGPRMQYQMCVIPPLTSRGHSNMFKQLRIKVGSQNLPSELYTPLTSLIKYHIGGILTNI